MNTSTICASKLYRIFVEEKKNESQFYLCNIHRNEIYVEPCCEMSETFENYKYAFLVKTALNIYAFMPPVSFVSKNFKFFISFVKQAFKGFEVKRILKQQEEKFTFTKEEHDHSTGDCFTISANNLLSINSSETNVEINSLYTCVGELSLTKLHHPCCMQCKELRYFKVLHIVCIRSTLSLNLCTESHHFLRQIQNEIKQYNSNCLKQSQNLELEQKYYQNFIKDDFRMGNLPILKSGKRSFVRTKILGTEAYGARMTLTVDCTIGPQYVSVAKCVYNYLISQMATNLVIVNRDPSINSKCIYVCELLFHDTANDFTLHVNPFILDGLHADQDGDALSIYVLRYQKENPSFSLQGAIKELQALSWRYGRRHDTCFRPRYSFSQYHKWILYKYDEWFSSNSNIWKSLQKYPTEQKCNILMHLGCTIFYHEIDHFIKMLIDFCASLKLPLVNAVELMQGKGTLEEVVSSRSKGNTEHIKLYLKLLYGNLAEDQDQYENTLKQSFDKYVHSSKRMATMGHRQFILLYGMNDILLFQNRIYFKEKVIVEQVNSCVAFFPMNLNLPTVDYILDSIVDMVEFEKTSSRKSAKRKRWS